MAHNRLACSGKLPAPVFGALVVPGYCPAGRCASDLFKTTASFRFGWLRLLPGPSLASLRSRLSRHILAPLRYSTVRPLRLANSFTGQVSASVPKGTRHRASERYSFGSHLTYQSGQAIRGFPDAAAAVAAARHRARILPVHSTNRQLLRRLSAGLVQRSPERPPPGAKFSGFLGHVMPGWARPPEPASG